MEEQQVEDKALRTNHNVPTLPKRIGSALGIAVSLVVFGFLIALMLFNQIYCLLYSCSRYGMEGLGLGLMAMMVAPFYFLFVFIGSLKSLKKEKFKKVIKVQAQFFLFLLLFLLLIMIVLRVFNFNL